LGRFPSPHETPPLPSVLLPRAAGSTAPGRGVVLTKLVIK
jgi:hypothetical protein